ncbi:MAG: MFS transporter, partial [Anaerolineae bacterium]
LSFAMGLRHLQKAFHLKEIRILFICVFLFSFGWSFFYEFIPVTWIAKYDFQASTIGLLYGYASAFYALSSGLLIRPVVSRFKPSQILFYALALGGGYILFLLCNLGSLSLWFYLPPLQFFIALLFPTATTLISNEANQKMQGEILGVLQSVQSTAFGLSPLLSGSFLGLSQNMPALVGGLAFLCAALILGISLRQKIFHP